MKTKFLLMLLIPFLLASCANVKGYQKVYINDPDMALVPRKSMKFAGTFQSYREGTSGASSGKSGGGCGCN